MKKISFFLFIFFYSFSFAQVKVGLDVFFEENHHLIKGKKVGIMATDESLCTYTADSVKSIGSRKDSTTVAKNLFRLLRDFDDEKVDIIMAEGIAPKDLGLAVMNRLRKAADFNVVKA